MSKRATAQDVLIIILAILLPPVAVFIKTGLSFDLLVNILLCLLGFLPGLIHALWIIARSPANQGSESEALIA